MIKPKQFILFLLLLIGMSFVAPTVFAQKTTSGLIPCGNDESGGVVTAGQECTYDDLIRLTQTVINFLIFAIAAPVGAVMFAYAGFLYVTNGGNEAKIKQAHDTFLYVFIGLVVALAAWLVVKFILDFLIGTSPTFNFLG